MAPSSSSQFAVVTGASSGIGLELAKVFAEHGFDVLMAAEDAGINAAAESVRSNGAHAEAMQVDLSTHDGVEQLFRRIRSSGRPVDAIAINAGIGVGGPFVENDLERELRLINLNVVSTVHLAKLVVRDMMRRGDGRVLFTSSIAADMPAPFEAVYGASKAFVQSFSEALRNELKDTGVVVTALQPGATDTNFFRRADMEDTKVGSGKKDDPAAVARAGFEALMKGKDHVVAASMKNKVLDTLAKLAPETASAQMHRKQAEPGSAKQ